MPWGGNRYSSPVATPTTFRNTGQREAEVGLYFHGARFYDSSLGRFVSPDTVIPQQQGSQAWDRYAGMNNNPVRYTDPTGHDVDCGMGETECRNNTPITAPNGVEVPNELPDFNDPLLVEAWIWLYNSRSGRYWAEYIRDNNIPVVFGEQDGVAVNCSEPGCSISPGTPITLESNPGASVSDPAGVRHRAGVLAQEAYHYSRPYGDARLSLLEEFNSFRLRFNVINELQQEWVNYPSGVTTVGCTFNFDGVNPLDPSSLVNWFNQPNLRQYIQYVRDETCYIYP